MPETSRPTEQLTDRSWIEEKATRKLVAAFDAAGIDFRFVGGAVRDSLLGRSVSDIDVATSARPEAVAAALSAGGIKAIPTGIAHGTVTGLVGRRHFEITTLRRDVETDGRHAVVAFTDDWREDASRRDFTMNALYADRDGAVTDYFGGIEDAKAGRVRFIGDPQQRIAEDALRILRFFRFHAWYGQGKPDADGLAACARLAGMIDRLSAERVRVEILKTLAAPDPSPVWQAMIDAGIMAHVLPAATHVDRLRRMVALERTLGLEAAPLRRLAALLGDAPPAVLKDRLKLSNQDGLYLKSLAGSADRVALVARGRFGPAVYKAEPGWVLDAALLAHIQAGTPGIDTLKALSTFLAGWTEPRFPLTGADLQAVGVKPGPEMGRLLRIVEDWWLAADFGPDRTECLAKVGGIRALKSVSS